MRPSIELNKHGLVDVSPASPAIGSADGFVIDAGDAAF